MGAPGEGAAAVTQHQGAADGGGNTAGAAADVQCLPISTCGHEAAIAGHSSQRFRGNAGAILQGGRPSTVWPKHLLIQVNHDLEALAAGSRHGIAGQERLGELHRPVSPRGPARFRGNAGGFELPPPPLGRQERQALRKLRALEASVSSGSARRACTSRARSTARRIKSASSGSSTNSSLTIPPGSSRWRTERSSGVGVLSPSSTPR